ncbi:alpha/beta hydrolase [Solwaraspora sp. WMMD791]|uniref:alpha/beta fold hydrolase n=1 Tax=Solwaraspora sp. WMMD791 TaxID=3016086 RepID=UPI00249BDEA4|nr:alpha/beta hydrolase [Solwaraspora sp. WMMD791]WFE27886.1 alpha/beta hydrolase [Solwaraspora sp. WMMD791]
MRAPVNVTIWDGPAAAAPAILIHGTLNWAASAFERQRPLARHRRVLLPDRRGYGDSPDLDDNQVTSDYAVDAQDVVALMNGGVDLVGHSYGGTVAMIAAAARPDLVRSLTLIEPCAHRIASEDPSVAAVVQDAREFMADARRRSARRYLDLVYPAGQPRPEPADWLERAARTALNERPCWLADLATQSLADAGFAKLVIVGDWGTVSGGYRPGMAQVMEKVAATVADRIGARLVRVCGAAHEPHREQPDAVNKVLEQLWSTG